MYSKLWFLKRKSVFNTNKVIQKFVLNEFDSHVSRHVRGPKRLKLAPPKTPTDEVQTEE